MSSHSGNDDIMHIFPEIVERVKIIIITVEINAYYYKKIHYNVFY